MLPSDLKLSEPLHCPLCGAKCDGNRSLGRHLASRHGFTQAAAFTLSNLLYLDVQQAVRSANGENVNELAQSWDISASQAAGHDVPRRRTRDTEDGQRSRLA